MQEMATSETPTKYDFELEEQFILRLPRSEAKTVRRILTTKPKKIKKVLSIDMDLDNMRTATVQVKRRTLNALVMDLPTVVESHKTLDNVHVYKTADIGQVMVCQKAPFPVDSGNIEMNETTMRPVDKMFRAPHGITAPMKNAKKRHMRKSRRYSEEPAEAREIDKELMYLFRMDLEAVSTRYELVYEEPEESPKKSDAEQDKAEKKAAETSIFGDIGDITDCSSDSSNNIHDIMDYTN